MRVVVVGAGHVGSIHWTAAHENGHEVWSVDTSRTIVDEFTARGPTIDRRDGPSEVHQIPAISDPASAGCIAEVLLIKGLEASFEQGEP